MNMAENLTLEQLFTQAAKLNIHKCAVVYENERKSSMSYSELIDLSACISSLLTRHSLFKELVVCISKPHLLIPSMILGILQANCSFCFADLKNPSNYLKILQKYIKVKFMLCEWHSLKDLERHNLGLNKLDEISSEYGKLVLLHVNTEARTELNAQTSLTRESFSSLCAGCAYVIQTSGTTGEPKIVQVPHRSIVPNIVHLRLIFQVSSKDKIIQLSPLTFDPSIVEIFLALTSGACLVIVSHEIKAMPKQLAKIIHENNITIMQATPTLVNSFGIDLLSGVILHSDSSLRILALGGEACPSTGVLQKWQSFGSTTKFYNLYGITEVSCWATYHEITREELQGKDSTVPLGNCLSETRVQLLDSSGMEIQEGEGELFVGGANRQCFINGKIEECSENVMKSTGDWVQKTSDGTFYYIGRKDSSVKHNGKKVNIAILESAVQKLNFVNSCSVLYHQEDKKLYIFVVCVPNKMPENDICAKVVEYLRKMSTNVPFQVLLISSLPQTHHGKIDSRALLNHIASEKAKRKRNKICNVDSLIQNLSMLWKKYTGIKFVPEHSQFIPDGGDSITAVQLASEIEWEFGNDCPLLIDKLLNATFKEVTDYLILISQANSLLVNKDSSQSETVKRTSDIEHNERKQKQFKSFTENAELLNSQANKTIDAEETRHFKPSNNKVCCKHFSRRGQLMNCFCSDCSLDVCLYNPITTIPQLTAICLQEIWKYDLGKCVDASPLVVKYKDGQSLVFIGSHSGHFAALVLQSGEVVWEQVLNDRIESSACMSLCGHYLAVGCYDYCIYCMEIMTGKLHWKIQTDGEVKSSPVSDIFKNVFFCGSHDKFLYAVMADTGVIMWKQKIGNGSIFSSPTVNKNPHYVVAASLDGIIACLNPENGNIVWKFNCGKPIFSSPLAICSGISVGCVNNFIYFWNHQGEKVWEVVTDGPVFSSPSHLDLTKMRNKDLVVIGSQSGFVYCIDVANGSIIWQFQANSSVYATPYVFLAQDSYNKLEARAVYVIAAASKIGTLYILDAANGKELCKHSLSGEIFSSPVVCDNYLLIACRNNYVYCFDLLSILQNNK